MDSGKSLSPETNGAEGILRRFLGFVNERPVYVTEINFANKYAKSCISDFAVSDFTMGNQVLKLLC